MSQGRKRALLTPIQPVAKRAKPTYEDSSKKVIKGKIRGSYNIMTKSDGKEVKKVWKLDDFDIGRKLGTGKFAKVYLAREKESGIIVALKVLEIERLNAHGAIHTAKNEIRIMSQLRHENILRCLAFFWDDKRLYLVLEYASGGELWDAIREKGRMSEEETAKFVSDLASALLFCHKKRVLHRDIKPENLLIDANGLIKLSDFGYAIHTDQKRKTFCGTAEYLPPEIVNRSSYTDKVDVWALGVLTYELLSGRAPFEGDSNKEVFKKIKCSKKNLKFPSYFSEEAKDFISQLLKINASERLGLDQVQQHPFMQLNLTQVQKLNYNNKTPKRKKNYSSLSPKIKNNTMSLLQPPAPTSKILLTPEGKRNGGNLLNSQDAFFQRIKKDIRRDLDPTDSPEPRESVVLKNLANNTGTQSSEAVPSTNNDFLKECGLNDSCTSLNLSNNNISFNLLNDSLESRSPGPENDLDEFDESDIRNTSVDDFGLFALIQDNVPNEKNASLLPSQTIAYEEDSDEEVAIDISQASLFQSASLI